MLRNELATARPYSTPCDAEGRPLTGFQPAELEAVDHLRSAEAAFTFVQSPQTEMDTPLSEQELQERHTQLAAIAAALDYGRFRARI